MRKIIVFNLISLDGFYARENGDIDWHNVDDEFNLFAVEHTRQFGTIVFGRITYQMFETFWPAAVSNPEMSKEDLEIAHIINNADKVMFSKTLSEVKEKDNWSHIRLFNDITTETITKLKAESGKDIVVFGSGTVCQQLTNMKLVDEYRLLVNPILLGKGKAMFANLNDPLKLKLLNTRPFNNGNILLSYVPQY